MLRHSVRQRCHAMLTTLDIPAPWDLNEFLARLERRRGRSIRVIPLPQMPRELCGIYVPTDTVDYVFHDDGASPLHREHIIMHEIGHVIFGHDNGGLSVDDVAPLLFPRLDPAIVRRVLGRTATYQRREEAEAETLATMIMRRADRDLPAPEPSVDPEDAEVLHRLEDTWGRPRRRDHR